MSKQSKEERFTAVTKQYHALIAKIVRSYCPSPDGREDLSQDILYQLWKSFDKYDSKNAWSTWIYRISLNVAISHYRKNSLRTGKQRNLEIEEYLYAQHNPSESEERAELLYQMLNQLNELDKAIMILYLEERPHSEIAEIMGLSKSNVGTRISRIKEKLKTKYKANDKI